MASHVRAHAHRAIARSLSLASRAAAAANGTTTGTTTASTDSTASAANTAAASAKKAKVDVPGLMLHFDGLLLAFLALVLLLRLPRLLARLGQPSAWSSHVLRPGSFSVTQVDDEDEKASPASLDSHVYILPKPELRKGRANAKPWRAPALWAAPLLHPLVALLRAPVAPGTSIGQCALLALYFGALVYPVLYKSNPFSDPVRLHLSIKQYAVGLMRAWPLSCLVAPHGLGRAVATANRACARAEE
jgi:hypothetical protein